jgi:acetyltransferase-like isoleucine patch superfamily enzyme
MASQLRQHLKFTWRHWWRAFIQRKRLGALGDNIHLDKNVEFMRFPKNISIGNDVVIKEGTRICSCNKDAIISIGSRTTIGYHNFIFASESIVIGDDCLIAPFVYIVDSNHQVEKGKCINEQPNVTAPIKIGNGVWIASNVTILKGVVIAEGAVIGANSVVNHDVAAYEIWAGTPAKKIGDRT